MKKSDNCEEMSYSTYLDSYYTKLTSEAVHASDIHLGFLDWCLNYLSTCEGKKEEVLVDILLAASETDYSIN